MLGNRAVHDPAFTFIGVSVASATMTTSAQRLGFVFAGILCLGLGCGDSESGQDAPGGSPANGGAGAGNGTGATGGTGGTGGGEDRGTGGTGGTGGEGGAACLPNDVPCMEDSECCAELCFDDGYCGLPACAAENDPCVVDADCCDDYCNPIDSLCGGCMPLREGCVVDEECCEGICVDGMCL